MSNETSPTHKQVATLKAQVFALVNACPAGRVTTYGWIGKALGYPRGARMIGWIMNEAPTAYPRSASSIARVNSPAVGPLDNAAKCASCWRLRALSSPLMSESISNATAGTRHATSTNKN